MHSDGAASHTRRPRLLRQGRSDGAIVAGKVAPNPRAPARAGVPPCVPTLPAHGRPDPGRGKLNVSPVVNSQSGAPRLNPLLIPASTTALSQGGCQSTPRRPELLAACPRTLSPLTSPTNRTVAAMGSSVITPQTPKGCVSSRSSPPPRLRWKVNGAT